MWCWDGVGDELEDDSLLKWVCVWSIMNICGDFV